MVEQDKNQISEQEAELYDRQIRYINQYRTVPYRTYIGTVPTYLPTLR